MRTKVRTAAVIAAVTGVLSIGGGGVAAANSWQEFRDCVDNAVLHGLRPAVAVDYCETVSLDN